MTAPGGTLRAAGLVVGGGLVGALLAIVLTEGAGWRTPAPARAGDASRDAGTAEAMRALTTEIAALRAALATAVVPASGAPVPVPREARDAAERLEPLVRRMESAAATAVETRSGSSPASLRARVAAEPTSAQSEAILAAIDQFADPGEIQTRARRAMLLSSYEDVIDRFGPPGSITTTDGGALVWTYWSGQAATGKTLTVQFLDGLVTGVW